MGDTRNSVFVRIPSAIVLLLLSVVLSCKHSAKPQPGPSQAHVGNLLEVEAAPGVVAVQAQIGGAVVFMASPVFVWGTQTVTVVPLVPPGTKLIFDPSGTTPRTVEVVAGPSSGTPGVATLAFLDMLGTIASSVTTDNADTQAALSLLASTAAGLRDEVMIAQNGSLALGSFGGTPLVLDADALTLFDAALAGSAEAVVPLAAGSSVAPRLGAARSYATQPPTKPPDPPNPEKAMWGLYAIAGGIVLSGFVPLSPVTYAIVTAGLKATALSAVVAIAPLILALLSDVVTGSPPASDPLLEKDFAVLASLSSNPDYQALISGLLDFTKTSLLGGPDGDLALQAANATRKALPTPNCPNLCGSGFTCRDPSNPTCVCDLFYCAGGKTCVGAYPGQCRGVGAVGAPCSGGADCSSGLCSLDGKCISPGTSCGDCAPPKYCDNEKCCVPKCLGAVGLGEGASCPQDDGCNPSAKCDCSQPATCQSGICCTTNCSFHSCGMEDICNKGTPCDCHLYPGYSCHNSTCVPCTQCDDPAVAGSKCGGANDCNPRSLCGCTAPLVCCSDPSKCTANTCCPPKCNTGKCGANTSDGCGGTCEGKCPPGFDCSATGVCVCTGNSGTCLCSSDSGGTTCSPGDTCNNGKCCHRTCTSGTCGAGSDGCGGDCGCSAGFTCSGNPGLCTCSDPNTCSCTNATTGTTTSCKAGNICLNGSCCTDTDPNSGNPPDCD